MNDSQYAMSLSELRGNALLLVTANDYLCEELFLIKIGNNIDKNVKKLKDDITSLRKEYPGKFENEVETDGILEQINNTAQAMLKPGDEVKDSCSLGELGRILEQDINSIADAVNIIKAQVQGSATAFTRKDPLFSHFSKLKSIGQSMGDKIILGAKILSCIALIAILAFLYLFFTMEKEGVYLKEITGSQAYIQQHKELLSQLELKKGELSKKIESLENSKMVRGGKIAIMDLGVEIHKINEDRHKIEAEIATHEKIILNNQKKVEELKKLPFTKRLLRR
ncbi:hypothetical protein ACFL7M_13815 [Thermodesulfobacteriota bacterium]